jgi:hypothetical protein
MRTLLLLAALACVCDDVSSPDMAGTDDLAASDVRAVVATKADLVGFASELDGSGSSDSQSRALSYGWHFTGVPAGSTITDASLSSTSNAKVSFEPDLGGDYTVELTVTAGGQSTKSSGKLTVPTLPIFFHQASVSGGALSMIGASVVRSDGSGRKRISCPQSSDAGAPNLGGFAFNAFHSVGTYYPATGRSLFAFPEVGGGENALVVAAEDHDCVSKAPPRVDQSSDAFYSKRGHFWPRFSPDGARLLFVDNPQPTMGTSRLVSVAVDGSNLRVIRTNANLSTAPPQWSSDGSKVAWVEENGTQMNPAPIVYQSSDAAFAGDAGGDRTVLADCSASIPILNQFAIVPGGLIIAGGTLRKNAGGSINLYRTTTASCTNVLVSEPAGGDAGDFAVSPDGSTVIISSTHGQSSFDAGAVQHDLFILPSDGSQQPKKFAGDATIDDIGPRFVAGGRQVVWTQGSLLAGGAISGGGIMIANTDGTHMRSLVAESNQTVVIGGSNAGLSCSWAGPLSGGLGALLAALIALLLLFARRRGDGIK